MPQFHRLHDIGICSLALEDTWRWRLCLSFRRAQDKMTFQLFMWRPPEPEDGIDNLQSAVVYEAYRRLGCRKIRQMSALGLGHDGLH